MSSDDPTRLELWKRFSEAASAEKDWMNTRLNWMFIPQSILISAYALIVERSYPSACQNSETFTYLGRVIIGTGLVVSVLVFFSVVAAAKMHSKWTKRLIEIAADIDANESRPTVPFGSPPHWPAILSRWIPPFLAFVFIVAWLAIICIGRY